MGVICNHDGSISFLERRLCKGAIESLAEGLVFHGSSILKPPRARAETTKIIYKPQTPQTLSPTRKTHGRGNLRAPWKASVGLNSGSGGQSNFRP